MQGPFGTDRDLSSGMSSETILDHRPIINGSASDTGVCRVPLALYAMLAYQLDLVIGEARSVALVWPQGSEPTIEFVMWLLFNPIVFAIQLGFCIWARKNARAAVAASLVMLGALVTIDAAPPSWRHLPLVAIAIRLELGAWLVYALLREPRLRSSSIAYAANAQAAPPNGADVQRLPSPLSAPPTAFG
jgi:hypothetical protein